MTGTKPPLIPLSPTSLTTSLTRSPQGSVASASVASASIDTQQLADTLDKIHTSAKEQDGLTTFNDLPPPPDSVLATENKGFTGDIVQNGFSGLYSRLKEVVGVSAKERAASTATLDPSEAERNDGLSKRSLQAATTSTSKGPTPLLSRIDTSVTNSTFNSVASDQMISTVTSSPAGLAIEGVSQTPQSNMASSVTNRTSVGTSKSASSSRQSIPNTTRPTAALAPVTVSAFKEKPRNSSEPLAENYGLGSNTALHDKTPDPHGQSVVTIPETSTLYDHSANIPTINKNTQHNRSSRGDDYTVDGTADPAKSPIKVSSSANSVSTGSQADSHEPSMLSPPLPRSSARNTTRRPAIIDRISQSRGSGSHSRSSSLSRGTAEPSPINTSAHNSIHHASFGQTARPQRIKAGGYRIPGTTVDEGAPEAVNAKLESMRRQVLSKDFWMADETCSECFRCNTPFTAFRRKHHCRTCGCIFDSGCTAIISGQRFGVPGTLRVCKSCLVIISQRSDGNISDDSADDTSFPSIFRPNPPRSSAVARNDRDDASISERVEYEDDANRSLSTPMMAIPATRRVLDSAHRHSAVLEIDTPHLSRPGSSRSLRSMTSGRPQSSGHRRHHSKHNLWNRFKATTEERAPFRDSASEEVSKKTGLPAFHDDNVIDPVLAQYMSDESSGDEQMSIMEAMAENDHYPSLDPDRSSYGPYVGSGRRVRNRTQGEKSVSGLSFTSRGLDESYPRGSRRRNLSVASGHHIRSPRPKSVIMKGPSASTETLPNFESPSTSQGPRLTRSSSMRGEKEPRLELNPASLLHVRKLLRQLLHDSNVPNIGSWEKALVPILLKCTSTVDPDIERGDDIDIRHYVKLKKIPGGRPSDTTYVSGVIFTKKLALKTMPRRMSNLRVVIVSFPIEYQRHQQRFMSLQPVIEQEREFLRQLVNRITALRPQLLLAEKSVSGLALQYLSDARIAVAYNVKHSVLSAVSRCLETEIISSVDMLALPPQQFQTGNSTGLEVKTFVNDEIPGRKKTYIFLSSDEEELGCTIALRGASTPVLKRLKSITEFMVYVVYNLKLESCLMRDSFIQLPTEEDLVSSAAHSTVESMLLTSSQELSDRQRTTSILSLDDTLSSQASAFSEKTGTELLNEQEQPPLSQSIERTNKLISLHNAHAHSSHDTSVPEDTPMPTFYSEMVAKYDTKILSASPFVKFAPPYLLMKAREQERRLVHLKRLRDHDMIEERDDGDKPKHQKFQLIKPQMVHETGHRAPRQIMEVLHAVHDAEYDKALYNYQTQTRSWENYIQGNLDLFDPYAHQSIVVLHSVTCTDTKIPCVEPTLIALGFYDEHADHSHGIDPDCTLGQYIEDVCYGAESSCTANGCDRKMLDHHRTYVHGEARITVFIEQETLSRSHGDSITMWNYCKTCKRETSEMEMSKGTWKYSFGKYLELSFWSRGTRLVRDDDVDGWNCPHDHHRDHIRYFGLEDKVIRVHYDPIDLLEIIVPRARITWKVEHDLKLKNEIFTSAQDRWTRFTTSVRARLKAIKLDNILPEKAEPCKSEVDGLTKKVQDEHVSLLRKLQEMYMNSKYHEVIPFNVVLREMLVKATEWDGAFAKFEADFLPTDKDIRRLTMIQLRKMFTDESKESLASTETSTEATDGSEKQTQQSTSEGETNQESQPTEGSLEHSQPEVTSEKPVIEISPQEVTLASAGNATLARVESLDLATPKSPGPIALGLNPPADSAKSPIPLTVQPPLPSLTADALPSVDSPTETTSSKSIAEQIDQLRRKQHSVVLESAAGTETSDSEPVKAGTDQLNLVPERGPSRKAGLAVSPPIVRAQSQPAKTIPTLPKAQSITGKKASHAARDKDKSTASQNPKGVEQRKTPTNESAKGEKKLFGLRHHRKGNQSSIPRFVGKRDSRVSTIRKHFEQLSREFEKEREKDRKKRAQTMTNRPFLQHSSTRAIVEVYEDVRDAVQEPGPTEEDTTSAKELAESKVNDQSDQNETEATKGLDLQGTTSDTQTPLENLQHADDATGEAETDDQAHNTSLGPTDDEQGDSDTEHSIIDGTTLEEIADSLDSSTEIPLELPKHDKMNFMKVLTNFWNERSASQWPPLDYPLNATDHIFIDSDIIVREDEPSSLIAFALSSEDYIQKLRGFHRRKFRDKGTSSDTEGTTTEGCSDIGDAASEDQLEVSLLHPDSSHYKYQFAEGTAKMLVKIFYAEQFDALRRKCGVADRIIESLSRCLKWDSKGGKTKSVFLKTQDDRLMMKSLSPIETAAFLKFAPAYFSIMAEALFHDLPSVIAKMLGFFQVIIKNPVTNTEIKLDLLLMENLFYDRSPTRIFDLKGSMRNRKIQSTGEQNEVLLDENMVEYIYESPLFAREHSKKLLRASVFNDTLFLARQDVMDYSLMIAVDERRKELVVGIIDCIRTYTWDKKLESWIKDRGFAGGGRNKPTVTSPKEYKSRFREAMARYILQAPNCWHQFSSPQLAPRQHAETNVAGDEATVVDVNSGI